jgi:cyclopropane fatty-acyl-phospholipid synthase-like methyltransferase
MSESDLNEFPGKSSSTTRIAGRRLPSITGCLAEPIWDRLRHMNDDDRAPAAGTGSKLLLNSPLCETTLDKLISRATECRPRRIVDHGCGWGEVLLRAVANAPGATGVGVEIHLPDLERARIAAAERGLTDRVIFRYGNSTDHRQPADLLINIGSYQAFGDIAAAARDLREDLRPGGRALFGAEYWSATPSDDELSHMWPEASVEDCLRLPELVDQLHETGWRILDLHDSTRTEFDDFEVGHLREREEWLAGHRDHRDSESVESELDQAWSSWLRGHRKTMGFASFVLA